MSDKMKAQTAEGPGEGRKNFYVCDTCGVGFISQDVDEGVTPFMTACLNPTCKGNAVSFMYAAPQAMLSRFPAAIEWYKPTFAQRKKLPAAVRIHCENGGLISRPAR